MSLCNSFPLITPLSPHLFFSSLLSPPKVSALFCPSLSLSLSSNSGSRDKGTDSQVLSRPWKKIGICKLWSEVVLPPPPPPPRPPPSSPPPPPTTTTLVFWQIFIQTLAFLLLVVNKEASFSHFQILLKKEMFLRNCMSFTSPSSPNPNLCLHKPRPSRPSHPSLPFPLSLHPKPKHKDRSSSSRSRLSSLKPALSPTRGPKEGRIFLRKFARYQRRVCLLTYGLGVNMAKNPSKAPHIHGAIIDVAARRGAWPGNKWSGTNPTRECS